MMAFGKLKRTENLDPKNNSNAVYYTVMVKAEGLETLVMTEKELERLRKRALKNPEDTTMVPSWWDKLVSALAGMF